MKKELVSIDSLMPVDSGSGVSFNKFVDFIAERSQKEKGNRSYYFKCILDKFKKYPQLSNTISIQKATGHEDILQLIAHSIIPMIEDENKLLWAFGKTFSPQIFYGSDAFYKLINLINRLNSHEAGIDKKEVERLHEELEYSLILEKIYGIKTFFNKEWIHRIINPETGLYQYFQMTIDWRFAGLNVRGVLPDFHSCALEECRTRKEEMELLREQLPLHQFEGTGFTIILLTDITLRRAVEQMAKVSLSDDEIKAASSMQSINILLQTIVGNSACQFGMLPFLTVNQRAAFFYNKSRFSIIARACWEGGVSKHSFTSFMNILQDAPRIKMYRENKGDGSFPEEIQNALGQAGLKFYMLLPAFHNNELVGVLEVSSSEAIAPFNEQQLADLQPAIHNIARILEQMVSRFNRRMESIVKDKFTTIQPSVQWKFNEAAWHYLRNNFLGDNDEAIESIAFTDVFPLYGAVDIRNSTNERNNALRADILIWVHLLNETIKGVSEPSLQKQLNAICYTCDKWQTKCLGSLNGNDEIVFKDFLKVEVDPLLQTLLHVSPELAERIRNYYSGMNEQTGSAFDNRRKLEMSMQRINNEINHFYEQAKEDLLDIYPCYFDKFRTDGIEYDIYAGQSIAPKITFKIQHLQRFRLWQVQSMASIVKVTNSLLGQLPISLNTTQLIYVHSGTLDICFRNDERRFDVEGSYNIRYQIVKKRIDKVNIRNSDQRLTQPGKIAIVYFNREDVEEYLIYVHSLQQQNILLDDLEYLELQELQGITGLRALRVGVRT